MEEIIPNSIIPTNSTGLTKVKNSIEITNKILSYRETQNVIDPISWWNGLTDEWKAIFLYQLVPEKVVTNSFNGTFYQADSILELLFDKNKDTLLNPGIEKINQILNLEVFEYFIWQISNLGFPAIDTLAPLKHLYKLKKIGLDMSNVSYSTNWEIPIGFEKNISEIEICDGYHVCQLKNFINVTKIDFEGIEYSDFEGIEILKKLENLTISCDRVYDLSPLGNLSNLKSLHLYSIDDVPDKISQIDMLKKALPNCTITY